jgi:hypothetical protein
MTTHVVCRLEPFDIIASTKSNTVSSLPASRGTFFSPSSLSSAFSFLFPKR